MPESKSARQKAIESCQSEIAQARTALENLRSRLRNEPKIDNPATLVGISHAKNQLRLLGQKMARYVN